MALGLAPNGVAVGITAAPVGGSLDAEVGQYIVGCQHVARLHFGGVRTVRIIGILHIELQALGHDALGNVVEHLSTHAASRSGQARLLYADDATVPRCVSGEETGKAEEVVHTASLVSAGTFRHLCRSGLARHLEVGRTCLLSQSATYHLFQDALHLLDVLGLGYLGAEHLHWELLYGFSVLHHLGDEARLNHLAVVGNGVVEGKGGDGRHLCLVTDAHPRQCRLAPVHVLSATVLAGHTYDGGRRAYERQVQVIAQSQTLYTLYKLLRAVAVVVVYDAAHTYIGTYPKGARQGEHAVATLAPVVVLHVASVHVPHTVASLYTVGGIHHPVVEGHENGGCFEHRTGFQQVAHRMVASLPVVAVVTFLQVDDGLDVACRHVHDDGHAHVAIYLLQLLQHCPFGQVLHLHIYRGNNVGTVYGGGIRDAQVLVQHLLALHDTIGAAQDGVVGKFQSEAGGVLGTVQCTDGTPCQSAETEVTCIVLIPVEPALVLWQAEHGQRLDAGKGIVVDAPCVHGPVAGFLLTAFLQLAFKLSLRHIREDMVQSHADGCTVGLPHRVVSSFRQCLEVHEEFVFGQGAGHQLAVAAQDITPHRLHCDRVLLLALRHLHPVVALGSSRIGGFPHDEDSPCRHADGNDAEAGYYLVVVELTHCLERL